MTAKIIIYPAAALFNARETYFNNILVERLENLGYQTNFPQRDGFEFGNLEDILRNSLPEGEINKALLNIIYLLDIGVLLPKSDVVLANLDEPLDEGVVVEATYAYLMGKHVIGFRTDVRSPYGRPEDYLGGTHFFPAFQCHQFISHHTPGPKPADRKVQMDKLAFKVHKAIQNAGISHQEQIQDYALNNPQIKKVLKASELLFAGISNIHSREGMEKIVQRYLTHKKILKEIGPKK